MYLNICRSLQPFEVWFTSAVRHGDVIAYVSLRQHMTHLRQAPLRTLRAEQSKHTFCRCLKPDLGRPSVSSTTLLEVQQLS